MEKIIVLSCIIWGVAVAQAACTVKDISGVVTTGYQWLKDARVCNVGSYTIAVPATPNGKNDKRIVVFQGGKPVLDREAGSTLLFNPNTERADLHHPIVDIWNGSSGRDIDRLWYQTTPDKNGTYVSEYDIDFDGQPDLRTVWKGNDISQAYAWYKGRWAKMGERCIVIAKRCLPAMFKDGQWRVSHSQASVK